MSLVSPTQVSDGTTADASDVNTPINQLAAVINGNIDNSNIVSGAAIDGAKLAANSIDIGAKASTWDGWIAVTDTWTYASSTTVTVPSDATAKYSVGDKVRFTNSGTKYFYITAVASTTLTLNGGTDYTVANAAISSINYSKAATPLGFPGWFNFTPTWTNLTVGNATQTARYAQHGKTVFFRIYLLLGSTTAVGTDPYFTLPVTASSNYVNDSVFIGFSHLQDTGTGTYNGLLRYRSTTTAQPFSQYAGGTNLSLGGIAAATPFTWTTNDYMGITGTYEAA